MKGSVKVKCEICGKSFTAQGIGTHRREKHNIVVTTVLKYGQQKEWSDLKTTDTVVPNLKTTDTIVRKTTDTTVPNLKTTETTVQKTTDTVVPEETIVQKVFVKDSLNSNKLNSLIDINYTFKTTGKSINLTLNKNELFELSIEQIFDFFEHSQKAFDFYDKKYISIFPIKKERIKAIDDTLLWLKCGLFRKINEALNPDYKAITEKQEFEDYIMKRSNGKENIYFKH